MRVYLLTAIVVRGVLCLATGFAMWEGERQPRITEETFAQIEDGMTREEVKRIFRRHSGVYLARSACISWGYSRSMEPDWDLSPDPRPETWYTDDLIVQVFFDRHGQVRGKSIQLVERDAETFDAFVKRQYRTLSGQRPTVIIIID